MLDLETALAKASKSRVDLRDPIANYHKFAVADVVRDYPDAPLTIYLGGVGLENLPEVIIGQPEFFQALYALAKERPLEDWKTYLRWHVLHARAPYLHAAAEEESFAFYGKVLRGQPSPGTALAAGAPRSLTGTIGEALGQLLCAASTFRLRPGRG